MSAKNAIPSKSTLTWWRSAVNFSFFLCLAACRTRSRACDTRSRPCVRCVLCWLAFPLAPALGSTDSAAGRPDLFVGFPATKRDQTSHDRASSATAPRLPDADHCSTRTVSLVDREISRFSSTKRRLHMPRSPTTPGRPGTRVGVPVRIAFPHSQKRRRPR